MGLDLYYDRAEIWEAKAKEYKAEAERQRERAVAAEKWAERWRKELKERDERIMVLEAAILRLKRQLQVQKDIKLEWMDLAMQRFQIYCEKHRWSVAWKRAAKKWSRIADIRYDSRNRYARAYRKCEQRALLAEHRIQKLEQLVYELKLHIQLEDERSNKA